MPRGMLSLVEVSLPCLSERPLNERQVMQDPCPQRDVKLGLLVNPSIV